MLALEDLPSSFFLATARAAVTLSTCHKTIEDISRQLCVHALAGQADGLKPQPAEKPESGDCRGAL
jgi:hypothetical protein